jgi:anti-anti-sigma regulatory factor
MYGNPTLDCDGAQVRAHCRQLATVVSITGDVDGENVDRISAHTKRFILAEKPVILDLSGVNSFSPESVSLLYSVDEKCVTAGVEWSLIASTPVNWALRVFDDQLQVPVTESVPAALSHFAEALTERRRLLPLLTKSA